MIWCINARSSLCCWQNLHKSTAVTRLQMTLRSMFCMRICFVQFAPDTMIMSDFYLFVATFISTLLYTFTRCSRCQVMHSRRLSLGPVWSVRHNSCEQSLRPSFTCHVIPAKLHRGQLCSCFEFMQVNFIAGKLLSYAPQPVAVVLRQLVTDVQNIIDLQPSTNGVARILVCSTQVSYLNCCADVYTAISSQRPPEVSCTSTMPSFSYQLTACANEPRAEPACNRQTLWRWWNNTNYDTRHQQ